MLTESAEPRFVTSGLTYRCFLVSRHRIYVILASVLACLLVIQYTISIEHIYGLNHGLRQLCTNSSRVTSVGSSGSVRRLVSVNNIPHGTNLLARQDDGASTWNWKAFFGLAESKPTPPPECPDPPPNLVGKIAVTYERLTWKELEQLHPEVEPGGLWRPHNCSARHHVAIIVPYRDRSDHLRIFLHHIHPFLQKQLINYGIYVIEQDPYTSFNRGVLLNIGFREAMQDAAYECVIFHDVDLLPENDYNLYYCPEQPRHMSAAVDEFAYKLLYDGLFGGVEAFTAEHFEMVNGFSNMFFGWGAEDDDLYKRIKWHGLNLTRYPMDISRYSMVRHMKNEPNPNRMLYDKMSSSHSQNHLSHLNRRKVYWAFNRQILFKIQGFNNDSVNRIKVKTRISSITL